MSKAKGNTGEREVAGLLARWWQPVEKIAHDGSAVVFVRTPMSGGWTHGQGFAACGDIMTNAARFPFSVEVKRNEGWQIDPLIRGKQSRIWKFWLQCQRDAEKANRQPMLWFRKNRIPWFVMLSEEYASKVGIQYLLDVTWKPNLFLRVDCGIHPALIMGEKLLELDPLRFANK